MRKKPCGSRSGTQKSDRIMIRSPGSWSGAKLLWSGIKIKGFRMTEVGHEKFFFIKVSKSSKSQKSEVKNFTFLYWVLEKDSRFPQSIISRFTYHWPLQPAVVHMTISFFDYYFFPLPGFEPGDLCQRAGNLSTRPLRLISGWCFQYISILSTYLHLAWRYTQTKTEVRILLSPPLTSGKV